MPGQLSESTAWAINSGVSVAGLSPLAGYWASTVGGLFSVYVTSRFGGLGPLRESNCFHCVESVWDAVIASP